MSEAAFHRETRRFFTVGIANTVVGLLVIYLGKWLLHMDDVLANGFGYAVGLLLGFALNSRWTFAYRGRYFPALLKFVFVTLVAYGLNLVTVLIAITHMGLNGYVAQAAGVVPYTVTSFLGSKYLIFRRPET